MKAGQVSEDTEVGVAASLVWDVYRGLGLGKMVDELLPDVLGRFEVIEGDGGVGTIVKLTFPQEQGYMKEKFTKIDDEKRIKETEQIEGGFKPLGFQVYRIRLEILEKDAESSIIRSTIEYEIEDQHAQNASLVSTEPLATMAQVVGKYLAEKQTNNA